MRDGAELEGALREAFLAGVRVGRRLERERAAQLSTVSTPPAAVGFFCPPPLEPPSTTSPLGNYSPDPDPDPRSMGRANFERGTLELFPRRVPLVRGPKPRCRVPEDMALTPALQAFAEAGGLDARQELAAMKDHFRANGELKADWPATFREWCRRSLALRERRGGRP